MTLRCGEREAYGNHTLQTPIELVDVLQHVLERLGYALVDLGDSGVGKGRRTMAISPTSASRCWKNDDLLGL